MKAATTLPRLLHRNAASFGHRPAIREKRGGIWQVLSWSDYAKLVSRFAAGLAATGFSRGQTLAVAGDNRPRLYAALLAAQSLGGCAVPLWPDAEPDWLANVLSHAGCSIVVAEDAEQVDKIAAIKEKLPSLRLVVQTTTHGMRQTEQSWLTSFDAVIGNAAASLPDHSAPNEPAVRLYPRAENAGDATLSHARLLAAAEALAGIEDVRRTDDAMAWLPMAWFGDVLGSLALALSVGFTCNCPEAPETVWRDLREIGPTMLIATPGVWESMFADIEARGAQASRVKRTLFNWFCSTAEHVQQLRSAGESVPMGVQIMHMLGNCLIHAPLRDQMGLRRLRWANTAGEPLSPRVLQGFRAFGVNLKQNYGMPNLTEAVLEPAHA